MREKIAKEIYEGITGLPWPPDDTETKYTREKCMKHAAAILSLPVEGCGEVKEKCQYWKEWPRVLPNGKSAFFCGKECKQNPTPCNDTGFISRPITLQAVLNLINDALTFKDK